MNVHLGILDQSPIISGHAPARAVIGDPSQVRARRLQLREQFDADELMLLTITGDYASRLKSYALLAREFGLQ
jgi:alkanesulfonate monooxygenase SsuD/methylene tetrahydromethanopterin reductase-like flavin-dependent oxidoreductase (luciferase family)